MQVNVLYRPSQTVAQVWLQPNEAIMAESGAMMGMSTNVNMQTQSGGLLKGLKRMTTALAAGDGNTVATAVHEHLMEAKRAFLAAVGLTAPDVGDSDK